MEGKTMNDYNLLNYSFTAWPTIDQYNERTDNKQPQETDSGNRVTVPLPSLSLFPHQKREEYSYKPNVNGKDIFANNVLYNYLESINNNPFKMFASKIPDEKPIAKEQPVVWDRYLTIPGKEIEPKQEDGSNSPLVKNVLFNNYLFPDNPFNPYPTLFQYKEPIHPPITKEQSMVMADIADNPKLVFTPEYTKWRQYIMQNSPKYLERLWKRLTAKEQDYVYENNYSAFTALSNEAKGKYGESREIRKNNEVAPRVLKPLAAAFAAPFAIEGTMIGLTAAEQQIAKGLSFATDKFSKTALGQKIMPSLTKMAESKVGQFATTAVNAGLGAYGAAHLASEDGIRKTVGHVLDGNLGDAATSAAGDVLDLSVFGHFAPRATKGISNLSKDVGSKAIHEDFADFNIMTNRMNSLTHYEGNNPFSDNKMTGFRKWGLDNNASPNKILDVESKYSPNNWDALKKYEAHNGPSGTNPTTGDIYMNRYDTDFRQIFPHEVNHRLSTKLFGDTRNSISAEEVNAAFNVNAPIWKVHDYGQEPYFIKKDFEEIMVRFVQIKNALGIKVPRALTESELKYAYRKFKEGSLRFGNNNMSEFFESIKDWKAAAKLSGKALSLTGIGVTSLNQYNNEEGF